VLSAQRRAAVMAGRDRWSYSPGAVTHVAVHDVSSFRLTVTRSIGRDRRNVEERLANEDTTRTRLAMTS
jgi:hypothetical protein